MSKKSFEFRQDFNDYFPLVYTKQFLQIREQSWNNLLQFSTWKVQKYILTTPK